MALMGGRFTNRLGAAPVAPSKRIDFRRYIILLALLICAVSYWALQKDIIGTYHDDGIYPVTAKSLSERTGYRIVSLPGAPVQTKYPIYILIFFLAIGLLVPSFQGISRG